MTDNTSSFNSLNRRTFIALLLSYVLLTSQLAPVAMALNHAANTKAKPATSDVQRENVLEEATLDRDERSVAPVPVPLRVAAAGMAPLITATKTDSFTDVGGGRAAPGSTITYSITITNSGPDPATNVTLSDTVDPNTTIVPGSPDSSPIGIDDTYNVVGNVRIQPNAAQGLLANDNNPETGNNTGLTASGPTTGPSNGQATVNSDGSFSYNPNPGFTGTDSFTYTVTDSTGESDTATVTLTIGTGAGAGSNVIWFVNSAAPPGGDGRLTNPFNCLVGAGCFDPVAADDPGDTIFLYNGSYTGGLTFLANQKLVGQGSTATLASLAGVTPPTYSDALPATNGTPSGVTITAGANALTVSAGGILLRGFTVGNTTGAKIFGSGFGALTAGDSTLPDLILNGTGKALDLTNGSFVATSAFNSVATTSSASQGISLATISGTVAFGSTTVSGSTTQGILIGTTTANINFGNTSVTGGTDGVSFQNNSSGTRTFGTLGVSGGSGNAFVHGAGGGNVTVAGGATLSSAGDAISVSAPSNTNVIDFQGATSATRTSAGGNGVNWVGTAGATMTFSALTIQTNAGTGLNATVGGTINVTNGTGTINNTVQAAPAIVASGIALNANFSAINSSGGTNGVSLTNVGGTSNFGGGSLSGASGATFLVSGGTVSTTFSGGITQANNAAMVSIGGGHITGTITFQTGTLSATNGTGLQFDNADGTYNFNGTNTLNGGDAGIDIINGSGGNFSFSSNSSITNPTGVAFNVNGGAGNIDYNGTISKTSDGRAIDVQNHTGGTVSFDGTVSSTSLSDGINLATNTGATINFTATLTINTSSSNTISFNATGGGLISATGSGSTLNSGTASALNVTSTSIGAGDLNFQSITSSGGSGVGINLSTTGAAGGLNVTGNGVAGTTAGEGAGGTISNKSGDAIVLNSTARVRLNDMIIGANAATAGEGQPNTTNNIVGDGIKITAVTPVAGFNYGLTLDNVTLSQTGGDGIDGQGAGNSGIKIVASRFLNIGDDLTTVTESVMNFGTGFPSTDQITGTVHINTSTFAGFTGYGFTVENAGNGTLNMTVENSVFKNNDGTTVGNSGIQYIGDGSTTANNPKAVMLVQDCTFTNLDLDGIEVTTDPGATSNITVRRTTYSNPNGDNAIHMVSGSADADDVETMNVLIEDTTITSQRGTLIFLKAGAGTYNATVTNTPGFTGKLDSGINVDGGSAHIGRGIEVLFDADNAETINAKVKIENQTLRNIGVDGIQLTNFETLAATTIEAAFLNNIIGEVGAETGRQGTGEGIEVRARTAGTMTLQADANTIRMRNPAAANPGMEGIDLDAEDSAILNATITGNNFNNPNNTGPNFAATSEAAGSALHLDIRNNVSSNGNNPDYNLTQTAGIFRVEGPGTGAVAAVNIASAQVSGTASVTGTVLFNNNTNVPMPTAPTIPTLPPAPPAALLAADGGVERNSNDSQPSAIGTVKELTNAELDFLVAASLDRWVATGLTAKQITAIRKLKFELAELPGSYLAEVVGDRIRIDKDGGSFEWFVDATPMDDVEFGHVLSGMRRYTDSEGAPAGRMDLLTAIMHEMGHRVGLSDSYSVLTRDNLMYGYLTRGERRLPLVGQAKGVIGNSFSGGHLLAAEPNSETLSPLFSKVSSGVSAPLAALQTRGSQDKKTAGSSRKPAAPSTGNAPQQTGGPKPTAQTPTTDVVVDPGLRYAPKPRAAALPPVIMGDNLTWNIGTLPAGGSVTITFQVVVDNPFNGAMAQVSNQGTVTADGGISVLTDDPSVGGMNDPTVTLIAVPPDLSITDASVAEPASGSTSMVFTLALSAPAFSPITVNLSTADGTATGGTCAGGNDYESVSGGLVTFNAGDQIKTFPVTVCSDAAAEGDETFTLNVNSAPGAVITDGTGTGTITANVPGTTIISELRTSGPGGAGDDFVEIYNNTDAPHTVPAGGYGLFKRGASCDALPVLIGTIPAGTIIPQRGHYLFTGSAYSLANYGGTGAAAGDQTLAGDLDSDFNVGLFSTTNPLAISTANRLDAVGFGISTGGVCDVLLEGTTLPPASGSTSQYSFVREFTLVSNNVPTPTDANDNATDFTVVSTAGTPVGANASTLGAPGPENLTSPPLKKFTQVGAFFLDQTKAPSAEPNRHRDFTAVTNGALGTLSSRRRFVNNTGGPITRLRFRIYDITTFPASTGVADLRALTSVSASIGPVADPTTCALAGMSPPCTVTVLGTTLEEPPTQSNGGGLNSSMTAGTITMGTPLADGASINLQFLFGIQQSGSFRVFVFVEALP